MNAAYRGRFAPSPTGPLHFGSLIAALGSYLDARQNKGEWHLRIDDLDRSRCSASATTVILDQLEKFGFQWDGPIFYQSMRNAAYQAAFEQLLRTRSLFPCSCSRKEMADSALSADGATLYQGTCRDGPMATKSAHAWRVRVGETKIAFDDQIQGRIECHLEHEVGDYVIKRADGLFAYQLAVVVDDAEAGFTHIVRGADLLGSTSRQIYLQKKLGIKTPIYTHLPVVLNQYGQKLAKQTNAPALETARPSKVMLAALEFLGQNPPQDLGDENCNAIFDWAIANWRIAVIPKVAGQTLLQKSATAEFLQIEKIHLIEFAKETYDHQQ